MTTYSGTPPRTNTYAVVQWLKFARYVQVLSMFGLPTPLPKNKTDNVTWSRSVPLPLTGATTPMAEGIVPTETAYTRDTVTKAVDQYGAWVAITDKIHDLHEDAILNKQVEVLGDQAGGVFEFVTWGVIRAGTNVFYANGSTRVEVDSIFTLAKQRAIVQSLKNLKAKMVTKKIKASVEIATDPVERAFICFAHTNTENDLRDTAGFHPTVEYSHDRSLPHEIGKIEDVRYITSPDLDFFPDAGGLAVTNTVKSTGGTQADVYPMVYIGQDSYGTVNVAGKQAVEFHILPAGVARGGDNLGQNGSVGWKSWFAAAILNETWLARLEVAVSDI